MSAQEACWNKAMSETAVVIPCYNEADRLRVDCFHRFARRNDNVWLLFVNDGSKDRTLQILNDMCVDMPGRYVVLDLPENVGNSGWARPRLDPAARSKRTKCLARLIGRR